MSGTWPPRHVEAAVPPRQPDPQDPYQLARETVPPLEAFEEIFAAADRRNDALIYPELKSLNGLLENARKLLDKDDPVLHMIDFLQDTIKVGAELNFDIAYRCIHPIVKTIKGKYRGTSSCEVSSATKRRRQIDVRIESDRPEPKPE